MFFRRRSLWGTLLALWAERARHSATAWIRAALDETLRPALRWAIGMGLSYLIAAALAITAAVFFLSAAASGLVELGLPLWAAQLILAGVAAGFAFFFYKRAGARTLREEREEEEDGSPALEIKIEREPRPRRRRPSRAVYDVHPRGDAWELTSRSPRLKERFDTKEQALAAARRRASKGRPGRVVVHGADGTIQDVVDYRSRA